MVSTISTISNIPVTTKVAESHQKDLPSLDLTLSGKSNSLPDQVVGGRSQEVSEEVIEKRLEDINKILEKQQLETSYQKHEATNRLVIRLVDKETKEIVKEIPPEKLLDYAAGMDEVLGLFFDKRA